MKTLTIAVTMYVEVSLDETLVTAERIKDILCHDLDDSDSKNWHIENLAHEAVFNTVKNGSLPPAMSIKGDELYGYGKISDFNLSLKCTEINTRTILSREEEGSCQTAWKESSSKDGDK